MIGSDGAPIGGTAEAVTWLLDAIENKRTIEFSTACGIPLFTVDHGQE
ncbi:hypothetical protein [Bradyrhizobium sp. NAS80.1]|nr:hypothetical protein [Bradyrhizobium sp. NAS80.1]